tara:strand:+ start:3014 stop:3448 length:435 start_codon:yes stop_codon:yes gene_type:complete
MDIYCRAVLGTLRPADAEAEEALASIPNNTMVRVKVTRPRSVPHHRLFFGLLKKVYEQSAASEQYPSLDTFRHVVAIGAGHFDWTALPNGERIPIPRSIAFHKMDQAAFNAFFDAAVNCIVNKLHLVDEADLRREFDEMLGEAA